MFENDCSLEKTHFEEGLIFLEQFQNLQVHYAILLEKTSTDSWRVEYEFPQGKIEEIDICKRYEEGNILIFKESWIGKSDLFFLDPIFH